MVRSKARRNDRPTDRNPQGIAWRIHASRLVIRRISTILSWVDLLGSNIALGADTGVLEDSGA